MDVMDEWAPPCFAEKWDNVGLLVGDAARPVSRVLTALDVSEDVLREAVLGRFDMLVTHHPLIFRPVGRITTQNAVGKKLLTCIANGISVFCAHTNLDAAEGGTNDILFGLLGLSDKEALMPPLPSGAPTPGLVGMLPQSVPLRAFAEEAGVLLHCEGVRYAGAPETGVRRVGLCTGDATHRRYIDAALAKGCDVFVTGDARYHMAQEALEAGLALVDATHYATEAPIAGALARRLQNAAEKAGASLYAQRAGGGGQVFHAGS
jgi:dinuclear metal center YbgI/SA1388 family protein